MPGGGDWSGEPGHRCGCCGRRSENVGPRRGFDYINDVCGGCCELSSDDDGQTKEYHCRNCKQFMYTHGGANCVPTSSFDTYCRNCVKSCQLCCEDVHPYREMDKYSVPLDEAVKDIIEEIEPSIDVLGEFAKDGETIYLCRKCHRTKWKRHPNCGKPFPGFTVEEIDDTNFFGDEDNKRKTFRTHCTVEEVNASSLDVETKLQILQNYYTVEEINQSTLDDETKRQVLQNQQKGN